MKRTDVYQKMHEQLNGISFETIEKVLDEIIMGVDMAKNDSIQVKNFMKIGLCINGKHQFTYQKADGKYVDVLTINGKSLCSSCEKMLRLQYDVAGIEEYATFEDFVESEMVAQELIEE